MGAAWTCPLIPPHQSCLQPHSCCFVSQDPHTAASLWCASPAGPAAKDKQRASKALLVLQSTCQTWTWGDETSDVRKSRKHAAGARPTTATASKPKTWRVSQTSMLQTRD